MLRRIDFFKQTKSDTQHYFLLRWRETSLSFAVCETNTLESSDEKPLGPSPYFATRNEQPSFNWLETKEAPQTLDEWEECISPFQMSLERFIYQAPRHQENASMSLLKQWAEQHDVAISTVSNFYPLDRQCAACGSLNPASLQQAPLFHCRCGFNTTATYNYFSMLLGAYRYEEHHKKYHSEKPRYRAVS